MGVPASTKQTYANPSIREDLLDKIYRITPWVTPLISMIGRSRVKNVYQTWQIETLSAPDLANKVVEGDDAANDALLDPVRVGNYTQLSDKVAQVSSTSEAVDMAGKSSEMGHQIARKGLELRRDIEGISLSNQASSAGTAEPGGSARTTAGLNSWVTTNDFRNPAGSPVGSAAGFSGGIVAAAVDSSATRALRMF